MTDGVTYFLLFYLAILAAAGFGAARRTREKGAVEYFLAGRSIGPWTLSLSLIATSASAIGVVSLPAGLIAGPLSAFLALVVSVTMLLLMGTLIAPRYLDSGAITVPEFVSTRFGRRTGTALGMMGVLMALAVRLPLVLLSGSWVLSRLCGWEPFATAMLMIVVGGLYTIAGGMHAVLATHSLQAIVILGGAVFILLLGAGGEIVGLLGAQGTETLLTASSMPLFIAGTCVLAFWYWCSDQTTVQRFSSAAGRGALRGGAVMTIVMLAILVSVLDRAVSGARTAGSGASTGTLPGLIAGLMVLSAVLASVSMVLQSVASVVTVDLLRPFRRKDSEPSLVLAGRLTTVAAAVVALLVILSAGSATGAQLVSLVTALLAFSPPIAAVVLGALFSRRLNGRGAWWAFMTGTILGVIQVALPGLLGVDLFAFVPMSFALSWVVFFSVSLLTASTASLPSESPVDTVLPHDAPTAVSTKR